MLPALARSVCGSLGLGRALAAPRAAAGGAQQRALTAQHQQQPAVAPFSSGASADIEQQVTDGTHRRLASAALRGMCLLTLRCMCVEQRTPPAESECGACGAKPSLCP